MEWDCDAIPQVLTLWAFSYLPLSPEIIGTGFLLSLRWWYSMCLLTKPQRVCLLLNLEPYALPNRSILF